MAMGIFKRFFGGNFADFAVLAGNPAQVVGDTRDKDTAWLAEHPEFQPHYDAWAKL